MNAALEKIRAHFRSAMSGDMVCTTVPEWDDLKICARPLTGEQRDKVYPLLNEGKPHAFNVATLVQVARTEDGDKMFAPAYQTALTKECDSVVLDRVITELGVWAEPSEAEVKNS